MNIKQVVKKTMKKPELLSPAGNWPMLVAAIDAGADAVYFGVKQLNMRITANNFEASELKKICDYCRKRKVKAYLTLNTIVYDNENETVRGILLQAKKAKVDAVIAWDLLVLELCNKLKIPIHLSTQASVSNFEALHSYYKNFKIKRVVLARECSLEQIKDIIAKIKNKKLKIEIETFVHGAMCVSVSGRCFTSQFLFGKSANRGDCIQPCRRDYLVEDEEGKRLVLNNNHVMSAKDLCAIAFIDKLINAGINALKIEGRNKNPEYAKVVTECYREAIDAVIGKKFSKGLANKLFQRLEKVYNRGFSSGFYLGKPINEFTDEYGSKAKETKHYVGYVKNYFSKVSAAEIFIENKMLKTGDKIIVIGNKTGCFYQTIHSMEINHKKISEAKKGQSIAIKMDRKVRQNDEVFVVEVKN